MSNQSAVKWWPPAATGSSSPDAKASRPPAAQPPQTLLAGKLTTPLLQPGIVTRDRLLEMLDEDRHTAVVPRHRSGRVGQDHLADRVGAPSR